MAENPAPAITDATPQTLSPAEMSTSQLDEFFAKGTRFEKTDAPADDTPAADQPAESATADAVDAAALTDASPKAASETATPDKPKKGKGLKARVEQLDQENDGLSQRLSAALRRRRELHEQVAGAEADQPTPKADAKADPSPAAKAEPTEADFKRFLAMPGAPKAEQFDGDLDAYVAAMGVFVAKQIAKDEFSVLYDARQKESSAASAQERELYESMVTAEERAKADEARDPEWKTKLDPDLAAIAPSRLLAPGTKPHVMNFIKDQAMFECDHPPSMLVFMSTDEGKAWVASLTKLHPQRIVREIAIKDASFATPDDDDTTPSLVSKAPPPGEHLGRKATKPVDALKAAQESGNVEEFINQRNRQAVGARA